MQQTMETIIELNNIAITCIDANKFNEAVSNLCCALQLTKDQFYMMMMSSPSSSSSSSHHDEEGSMNHSETPESPGTPSSHHHQDMMMSETMPENNNYDHGDHKRMMDRQPLFKYSSEIKYQHPFPMFPEMESSSSSSSFSRSTTTTSTTPLVSLAESQRETRAIGLSAILIFNLALCFDLLASSSSSTTTKQKVYMAKAISLYEKVVKLYLESHVQESNHEGNDASTSTTTTGRGRPTCGSRLRAQQDVVVMAAVNNLIQLYQDEPLQQEKYLSFMMILLQEVQEHIDSHSYDESQEIQALVDAQARVFVANMIILSSNQALSPWPVAAAGAA